MINYIIQKWQQSTKLLKIIIIYCILSIVLIIILIVFKKNNRTNTDTKQEPYEGGAILSTDSSNRPNLSSLNSFIERGMSHKSMITTKQIIKAYYKNYNLSHKDNLIKEINFDSSTVNHEVNHKTKSNLYSIKFYTNNNQDKVYILHATTNGIDDLPKVEIGPDEKNLKTIFDPEK